MTLTSVKALLPGLKTSCLTSVRHVRMKKTSGLVKFDVGNGRSIAIVGFNRPRSLNAFSPEMVDATNDQLDIWCRDDKIRGIVFRSITPGIFCSGGDIKYVHERLIEKNFDELLKFSASESRLVRRIAESKRSMITIMDGLNVGLGVGFSLPSMFSVATERTIVRTPQIAIGCTPDIGFSYYLPRLPHNIGYLLGLSSCPIQGVSAISAGIATHFVDSSNIRRVNAALASLPADSSSSEQINDLLNHFQPKRLPACELKPSFQAIEEAYSHDTVEQILEALKASPSDLCRQQVHHMMKASPLALKVGLEVLRRGAAANSLEECIQVEFGVKRKICQTINIVEGLESVIDSTKTAQYSPANLKDITPEEVAKYFVPEPELKKYFSI